jgi:hypothetical protein
MLGESPLGSAPLSEEGALEDGFPRTRAILSVTATGVLSDGKLPSVSAIISVTSNGRLIYRDHRLHSVLYAVTNQRLHQVSYNLGDLPSRMHTILWTTEGLRTHLISYESTLTTPATSSNRLHEINYRAFGVESDYAYHEVSYNASALVLENKLHEVIYSSASFSTATHFHTVSYASFAPALLLHEILYQSVVQDAILHESGWKADIEQRRLHETRYHSISTTSIIDAGLITVGDGSLNTYDFMEISIAADEDSSYWQCEMTLKDSQDYIRFPRDTAFVIRLLDVDFNFIVDSRSLQRSIDDQGNYQETCTISGLSPLVVKSRPRVDRLTKTWDTPIMASAVVTELLGTNTWNVVDWMIPAYRLAAERADSLTVAKQVVEAVGGLIESEPGGGIVCRHRWPTSIAGLDGVAADHELDERVIYSANESPTQDELIDRVRIYDSEAGFQDRLEYVPNKIGDNDDPRNGILYAFISPWREGLRIVTTRPSVISVGASTEGTRSIGDSNEDYPAETITFSERTSSTSYPIMTLTSLDWLDEDLGAAVYTPYATTLEASNGSYGGYSLAKVEYVTRYLQVPIHCTESVEEIEAQFLLLETQNG